ncbi:MAG: cell division protein FtsL [Treponema sp.]|nr:cell division protein FtsL [Treponema sp.]
MADRKIDCILKNLLMIALALGIPGLLIFNGIQSGKYRTLRKEVAELEKRQERLIEENKKLITDISVLSSSDRIETIAENDLGMRKAETEEIVRVEIRKKGK